MPRSLQGDEFYDHEMYNVQKIRISSFWFSNDKIAVLPTSFDYAKFQTLRFPPIVGLAKPKTSNKS